MYSLIVIGPRYPLSDLWVQVSLTERRSADLTDVTLADEDNNSIPKMHYRLTYPIVLISEKVDKSRCSFLSQKTPLS